MRVHQRGDYDVYNHPEFGSFLLKGLHTMCRTACSFASSKINLGLNNCGPIDAGHIYRLSILRIHF